MVPGSNAALDASLSFVEGDTWGGIPSFSILISGAAPSASVSSAKMQFKSNLQASSYLRQLTSGGGEITIVSASSWTFSIPATTLSELIAGDYVWGFQTTDANGVVQTYLQGSIKVLPKIVV